MTFDRSLPLSSKSALTPDYNDNSCPTASVGGKTHRSGKSQIRNFVEFKTPVSTHMVNSLLYLKYALEPVIQVRTGMAFDTLSSCPPLKIISNSITKKRNKRIIRDVLGGLRKGVNLKLAPVAKPKIYSAVRAREKRKRLLMSLLKKLQLKTGVVFYHLQNHRIYQHLKTNTMNQKREKMRTLLLTSLNKMRQALQKSWNKLIQNHHKMTLTHKHTALASQKRRLLILSLLRCKSAKLKAAFQIFLSLLKDRPKPGYQDWKIASRTLQKLASRRLQSSCQSKLNLAFSTLVSFNSRKSLSSSISHLHNILLHSLFSKLQANSFLLQATVLTKLVGLLGKDYGKSVSSPSGRETAKPQLLKRLHMIRLLTVQKSKERYAVEKLWRNTEEFKVTEVRNTEKKRVIRLLLKRLSDKLRAVFVLVTDFKIGKKHKQKLKVVRWLRNSFLEKEKSAFRRLRQFSRPLPELETKISSRTSRVGSVSSNWSNRPPSAMMERLKKVKQNSVSTLLKLTTTNPQVQKLKLDASFSSDYLSKMSNLLLGKVLEKLVTRVEKTVQKCFAKLKEFERPAGDINKSLDMKVSQTLVISPSHKSIAVVDQKVLDSVVIPGTQLPPRPEKIVQNRRSQGSVSPKKEENKSELCIFLFKLKGMVDARKTKISHHLLQILARNIDLAKLKEKEKQEEERRKLENETAEKQKEIYVKEVEHHKESNPTKVDASLMTESKLQETQREVLDLKATYTPIVHNQPQAINFQSKPTAYSKIQQIQTPLLSSENKEPKHLASLPVQEFNPLTISVLTSQNFTPRETSVKPQDSERKPDEKLPLVIPICPVILHTVDKEPWQKKKQESETELQEQQQLHKVIKSHKYEEERTPTDSLLVRSEWEDIGRILIKSMFNNLAKGLILKRTQGVKELARALLEEWEIEKECEGVSGRGEGSLDKENLERRENKELAVVIGERHFRRSSVDKAVGTVKTTQSPTDLTHRHIFGTKSDSPVMNDDFYYGQRFEKGQKGIFRKLHPRPVEEHHTELIPVHTEGTVEEPKRWGSFVHLVREQPDHKDEVTDTAEDNMANRSSLRGYKEAGDSGRSAISGRSFYNVKGEKAETETLVFVSTPSSNTGALKNEEKERKVSERKRTEKGEVDNLKKDKSEGGQIKDEGMSPSLAYSESVGPRPELRISASQGCLTILPKPRKPDTPSPPNSQEEERGTFSPDQRGTENSKDIYLSPVLHSKTRTPAPEPKQVTSNPVELTQSHANSSVVFDLSVSILTPISVSQVIPSQQMSSFQPPLKKISTRLSQEQDQSQPQSQFQSNVKLPFSSAPNLKLLTLLDQIFKKTIGGAFQSVRVNPLLEALQLEKRVNRVHLQRIQELHQEAKRVKELAAVEFSSSVSNLADLEFDNYPNNDQKTKKPGVQTTSQQSPVVTPVQNPSDNQIQNTAKSTMMQLALPKIPEESESQRGSIGGPPDELKPQQTTSGVASHSVFLVPRSTSHQTNQEAYGDSPQHSVTNSEKAVFEDKSSPDDTKHQLYYREPSSKAESPPLGLNNDSGVVSGKNVPLALKPLVAAGWSSSSSVSHTSERQVLSPEKVIPSGSQHVSRIQNPQNVDTETPSVIIQVPANPPLGQNHEDQSSYSTEQTSPVDTQKFRRPKTTVEQQSVQAQEQTQLETHQDTVSEDNPDQKEQTNHDEQESQREDDQDHYYSDQIFPLEEPDDLPPLYQMPMQQEQETELEPSHEQQESHQSPTPQDQQLRPPFQQPSIDSIARTVIDEELSLLHRLSVWRKINRTVKTIEQILTKKEVENGFGRIWRYRAKGGW